MIRRVTLFVSGAVALYIGGALLFLPAAFRGQYGIAMADDPSLYSETRASGAAVLAVGVLLVAGAIVARLEFTAAAAGGAVYLAYALARGYSGIVDGAPNSGLILGGVVELLLGLACLHVLTRRPIAPT
ncbi:DUF4345 domain-containing protein [Paractinoplanes hotanensis]|uniref:DUF4345 domain-containing protein n=1 Tax=Paractinoplanes hotanensis TaxID=2906497 RepID=A0ABT0XX43_9ACTN|nr:DUF4345 domain-containing protein [Actinoplanes hotanensis]MCM4078329.1 DUF4345 domain-containing protein [Actinoplanes hotanensis]